MGGASGGGKKTTVFDEFISGGFNFGAKFSDLMNKFLKDLGDNLDSQKLFGDLKIKDLLSFAGDIGSGKFLTDLEGNFLKGFDQFKQLAEESLGSIYTTAQGFLNNMAGSYLNAILGSAYIPEDTFLWVMQTLKGMGGDPNADDILFRACLEHDLAKTLAWLDELNNTNYDHTNRPAQAAGYAAARYGSISVVKYVLNKIKTARDNYAALPYDPTNSQTARLRDEQIHGYDITIGTIVKTLIVHAYANFDVVACQNIMETYGIKPAWFGASDQKYGKQLKFTTDDINIMARVWSKGAVADIQARFSKSFKDTYIDPRNNNIKKIYLLMSSESKYGNDRLVHKELYTRLKSIIVSTMLKNFGDASNSLLKTGLGKFIKDPGDYVTDLIKVTVTKVKDFLFDPKRQTYIEYADLDSVGAPPINPYPEPGSTDPTANNVDPNIIDGVDLRRFHVFTYEDMDGDDFISEAEFRLRGVDMLFTILKAGYFKREDIVEMKHRTRVLVNGIFTGKYDVSNKNFFIFSNYDPSSNDSVLNPDNFKFLIMKYLIEKFGREAVSRLQEEYPNLDFASFFLRMNDHDDAVKASQSKSALDSVSKTRITLIPESVYESLDADSFTYSSNLRWLKDNPESPQDDINQKNAENIILEKRIVSYPDIINAALVNDLQKLKSTIQDLWRIWDRLKFFKRMQSGGLLFDAAIIGRLATIQTNVEHIAILTNLREGLTAMDKLDDVERLVAVSNLSVSSFDDLILALRDLVTQNVPKQIHGELVPRIKLLIQATNTAITIQPNTSPELILAMTQLDAMDSTLTARLGDFLVKNPNVSIDNRNLAISTKAIALASVVSDSMSIHDMLISAKTNSGVGTTILSVIQGLKVSQSTATNARFLTLSGVLTNGDAKSKLLTIGADTVTINDSKYDAIATLITSNLTAIDGEDATAIDSAISSLTAIQNDWVAIEDDKYRAAGKAIFGFDPEVHKIVNEVQSTLLTRILQEHDAAVSYLQGVFVANRSIVVSSVLSHISASKASLNAFIGTEIQGILDANRTLVGDSQIATIRDDLVTKCGQIYDDINAFIRIDQDDLVALTQIILKSMYDYVDGRFNVLSNYTATSFVSMFEVIRVNMVSADLKNLFDEITDLKNQIQKLVRDSTAMQTSNPSITKSIMENMDNMNTLIPLIMGITAGYRPIEEYTSSETVKSSNPYAAKRAIPTFGSSGNEFADDDGFKKPVVHKSGPLSTEDEDRRLNQMYSAGDLDIDDPRSLVLLDQALALGSIDKRTFIIGFDDTIEYYRLGGMFAN